MTGWHTVHVRVNDGGTGQSVPVRMALYSNCQLLPPLGYVAEFPSTSAECGGHLQLGPEHFHTIFGACEVTMPVGKIDYVLSRGPEYLTVRDSVTRSMGQIALRLTIPRWINLQERGWFAGDVHVCDLAPHAALLEGQAENLAVVNLLVHETAAGESERQPPRNLLAFSGQESCLEEGGTHVVVNSFNQNPLLGSVVLLNCHRRVFPLRAGDAGLDSWTVSDWCDQCHRKKTGLVLWADPRTTATRLDGETLADCVLGKIDGYEVVAFDAAEPAVLSDWYRLLDAGFHLPLAGGSRKANATQAVGHVRTYAFVGTHEPFGYQPWIEAVRAGRTFVTNGPLVLLDVAGQGPGASVEVEHDARVPIRIEARTAVPFDRLELLINGSVVAGKEPAGNRVSAFIETEWQAKESAWVAARCISHERLHDGQVIFAHTSPAYLSVRGRPFAVDRRVVKSLIEQLQRTWQRLEKETPHAADARLDRLGEVFASAQVTLTSRIARDG